MEKKYLSIHDIEAYNVAYDLSNYIWNIVIKWEYFSKRTVGAQFIEAADSVSANISEGFGRYFKKDKIKFYRYAFGSLSETRDWADKAKYRGLITEEEYSIIQQKIVSLPKLIHHLIKFTNEKLKI